MLLAPAANCVDITSRAYGMQSVVAPVQTPIGIAVPRTLPVVMLVNVTAPVGSTALIARLAARFASMVMLLPMVDVTAALREIVVGIPAMVKVTGPAEL